MTKLKVICINIWSRVFFIELYMSCFLIIYIYDRYITKPKLKKKVFGNKWKIWTGEIVFVLQISHRNKYNHEGTINKRQHNIWGIGMVLVLCNHFLAFSNSPHSKMWSLVNTCRPIIKKKKKNTGYLTISFLVCLKQSHV